MQAIGLLLASTGRAQVSMNLIDIDATPLWQVVEEVERLARERGVEVAGSELVGLMPLRSPGPAPPGVCTCPSRGATGCSRWR